ncbi:MAG: AAA family ATPase [Spirochaetes bacterium]|nr:AAA family ATPase [Spirochaetota bacterium]
MKTPTPWNHRLALTILCDLLGDDDKQHIIDELGRHEPKLKKNIDPINKEDLNFLGLITENQNAHAAARLVRRYLAPTPSIQPQGRDNPFIRELGKQLELEATECDLLLYLTYINEGMLFHSLCLETRTFSEFCERFSVVSGIERQEIFRVSKTSAKLISLDLIQMQRDHLCITDIVQQGIRGYIDLNDFHKENFISDTKPAFTLDSFDFGKENLDLIVNLLQAPGSAQVLFYGKPGSGKSELARALIAAAGLRTLHVPVPLEVGRSRIGRVQYTTHFAQASVLVVDEAEEILNTEGFFRFQEKDNRRTKAFVNTFFDQCSAKIIWIVNDYDAIHESVLRRFHFKLKFEKLSERQREQALDLILQKHDEVHLKAEPFLREAIKDEYLTPGILDNAIGSFRRMRSVNQNISPQAVIPRLLQSHKGEQQRENKLATRDATYRVEILNTSSDPQRLIESARAFYQTKTPRGGGLNFLLHGLPGTGKTEFVKHLAKSCNREIIFRRGSDLLSMFVGGSEKNISAAFAEAEKQAAILLVDEADTFFQPRESARHSWEISQTNEFLNQMENHRALLFCCTNLVDKLDAASMRRFHFKLEFRAMHADKRAAFFREYFSELLGEQPLGDDLNRELGRLANLTPGDFRAVRQRFLYRTGETLDWQELVRELKNEGTYKREGARRAIGF